MNFKQFVKILEQNTVGKHNDYATSAIIPSVWSGSETGDLNIPHLSSTDLAIPSVTTNSYIKKIELNKNPILILMNDNTKIYLSLDQFNRINPKPEEGKRISITFQRSSMEPNENLSKINQIKIY
jgi:hypothetical protein